VRTDAATTYFLWFNSNWIVYNPPTSRFFVTDPTSNQVFALDAHTETVVGSLRVPGAFGIDDTPDHLTLYVGTQIGDVYQIDPVGLKITRRYPSAQIGPNGFQAYSVLAMADGRLALLGGQGGRPGVDGYAEFALWNPTDNSISVYASSYGAFYAKAPAGSYTQVCGPMGNIGAFARTPDRSKVIVGSIFSDGTLCEVDEATGADNYVATDAGFIHQIVISPDGTRIVLPAGPNGYDHADVFDAQTLAQIGQFNVANVSGLMHFSEGPDSKTLYDSRDNVVYAYDLSTGQPIGWLPNISSTYHTVEGSYDSLYSPQFGAIDDTGLLAGPTEEGVGFLDTTSLRTGTPGSNQLDSYPDPASGPPAGDTEVTWRPTGTITDAYFGGQKAPYIAAGSSTGEISVTTPPGAPGPADVYALASDGGVQYMPEAFSYGPTILQITPDSATAEGGTGIIFGYGFGPGTMTTTEVPSDLRVTVGGRPVAIAAFDPNNAHGFSGSPFPIQSITYTIPPGTAGSAADVSVTTSSGSVTVRNAISYLPAVQQFPLPGAALAQGVYEPFTDLYYFTDATEIRVFSRNDGLWQPAISIPGAQRLWGIALSPDGSKLVVADVTGQAIYVLNPDNPSTVTKFAVPQQISGLITNPVGVAVSDAGVLYFAASNYGGTGWPGFFKLDTTSGQVSNYGILLSTVNDIYLRAAISADNSRVYFNNDGCAFSVDTTTDEIAYAQDGPGCSYGNDDLALSGNYAWFAATGYLYDADLNAESYLGFNLREFTGASFLYGEKLSPDGRLLFQPTTVGIDVLDGHLGNLLKRIALPVTLSPNYDALVADGKDNVLVAITGAKGDGIAVIDLRSVSEPPALPYAAVTLPASRVPASGIVTRSQVREAAGMASKQRRLETRHAMPHVTSQALLRRGVKSPRPKTARLAP
jgi:hypothetical protein